MTLAFETKHAVLLNYTFFPNLTPLCNTYVVCGCPFNHALEKVTVTDIPPSPRHCFLLTYFDSLKSSINKCPISFKRDEIQTSKNINTYVVLHNFERILIVSFLGTLYKRDINMEYKSLCSRFSSSSRKNINVFRQTKL